MKRMKNSVLFKVYSLVLVFIVIILIPFHIPYFSRITAYEGSK